MIIVMMIKSWEIQIQRKLLKVQDSLDEAFENTQILTGMNLQNLLDH